MVVLAEDYNEDQIGFSEKKDYEKEYEEKNLDGSNASVFIENLGEK